MTTTTISTISQTGSPDYSTLQSWEDAAPANLVTSDIVWQGVIQDASDAFSGTGVLLTVVGSTTDATRYKELTVAAGASFIDHASPVLGYNPSKGASATTSGLYGISNQESYFRCNRLQVQCTNLLTAFAAAIKSTDAVSTTFKDLILVNTGVNSLCSFATGTKLINTIIINNIASANRAADFITGASEVVNCLFIVPSDLTKGGRAVFTSGVGTTFVNCGFFGYDDTNLSTATYTNCFGDDPTPPTGVTTIAYDTTTGSGFENILQATLDVRLKSTSALIDAGTTDVLSPEDILGTTRSTYDVGPFEFASAAGSVNVFDNDGVVAFLKGLGYTGSYNDMLKAYLTSTLSRNLSLSDLVALQIKTNGKLL